MKARFYIIERDFRMKQSIAKDYEVTSHEFSSHDSFWLSANLVA